jgi:hypothetical protein
MLRKFSTNLLVGLSRMSNHYKAEKVLHNFRASSYLQLFLAWRQRQFLGDAPVWWRRVLVVLLLGGGGGESWWCSWAAALNRRVLDDGRLAALWG